MSEQFVRYRQEWFSSAAGARHDVLAGIVVALALIPEAIGFSIIAGVDPRVGLYASVAIAMTIALIGGRPGMISAATAAVAAPTSKARPDAMTWPKIKQLLVCVWQACLEKKVKLPNI